MRYYFKYLKQPKNIDEAVERLNEYLSFEDHTLNKTRIRAVQDWGEEFEEEISICAIQEGRYNSDSCRKILLKAGGSNNIPRQVRFPITAITVQ